MMCNCKIISAVAILFISMLPVASFGYHADRCNSFTIADAQLAYDSARSALPRGFLSPLHRYISWIDDGNLMIAYEPDFIPRKLVASDESNAVIKTYSSNDGRSIFYVLERTAPRTKELFRIELDAKGGQDSVLVATGTDVPSNPILAPEGQALVFADKGMLVELRRSMSGRWERRALLDADDSRHWSAVGYSDISYAPDGLLIAFISKRRAGQAYVAVHDVTNWKTRYVEPGVFEDASPTWSPNGAELAFTRQPVNLPKSYRFSSGRTGVPWSILAASIKTGKVRTIWKADPGLGSVMQRSSLVWAASGDILFEWEKTGWGLLYAVPASGGQARLLTPGVGEIGATRISADGRTLAFSTNMDDPLREGIWTVSLEGGRPVRLSSGRATEKVRGFSAGGYLGYSSWDVDRGPPQFMIRDPRGKVRSLPLQTEVIVKRNRAIWNHFLPTKTVAVKAKDGVISHHVITMPATPPPAGGYPVIVNAHGGPTEQTTPGDSYMYIFGQYAASCGYLFVDINYRGSTGFGLEYRIPDGRGAIGASEVEDLAALVAYLRSRGDVNTARLGIMGASYGGHIVGLAMSRLPDDFAAGVSLFGVGDWVLEMKKDQMTSEWASAPPPFIRLSERLRIEDLAYASSSVSQIDNWRGPTMFTIGELDDSGHMESVQDLGYQLLERGVPVEFYVDPAGGHDVFPQQKVFEFFERTLSDAR